VRAVKGELHRRNEYSEANSLNVKRTGNTKERPGWLRAFLAIWLAGLRVAA
jgi:hypothetical protein